MSKVFRVTHYHSIRSVIEDSKVNKTLKSLSLIYYPNYNVSPLSFIIICYMYEAKKCAT